MLAFWTMPGKKAPYLCIEPWHGCAASWSEGPEFAASPTVSPSPPVKRTPWPIRRRPCSSSGQSAELEPCIRRSPSGSFADWGFIHPLTKRAFPSFMNHECRAQRPPQPIGLRRPLVWWQYWLSGLLCSSLRTYCPCARATSPPDSSVPVPVIRSTVYQGRRAVVVTQVLIYLYGDACRPRWSARPRSDCRYPGRRSAPCSRSGPDRPAPDRCRTGRHRSPAQRRR